MCKGPCEPLLRASTVDWSCPLSKTPGVGKDISRQLINFNRVNGTNWCYTNACSIQNTAGNLEAPL